MSIPWSGSPRYELVSVVAALATFLSPAASLAVAKAARSLVRYCSSLKAQQVRQSSHFNLSLETGDYSLSEQCEERCVLHEYYSQGDHEQESSCTCLTDVEYFGCCMCDVKQGRASESATDPTELCTCNLSDSGSSIQEDEWEIVLLADMEVVGSERPPGDQLEVKCTKESDKLQGRNRYAQSDAIEAGCQKEHVEKTPEALRVDLEVAMEKKVEDPRPPHERTEQSPDYEPDTNASHRSRDHARYSKATVCSPLAPATQRAAESEGSAGHKAAIPGHLSSQHEADKRRKAALQRALLQELADAGYVNRDEEHSGDEAQGAGKEKNEEKTKGVGVEKETETEMQADIKMNDETQPAGEKSAETPVVAVEDLNKGQEVQEVSHDSTAEDGEDEEDDKHRVNMAEVRDKIKKLHRRQRPRNKDTGKSSSGESFSTACDSSSSEVSGTSDSDSDSKTSQDEDPEPLRDSPRAQATEITPAAAPPSQEEPSPIFAFVNAPNATISGTQKDQTERSPGRTEHSQNTSISGTSVTPARSARSDVGEIRGGFAPWLKSFFRAWLPLHLQNMWMPVLPPGPSLERSVARFGPDSFQDYDVRNLIRPVTAGSWEIQQPPAGVPCPHSCESSLCNYRRTLETLKRKLRALYSTLEETRTLPPSSKCMFCQNARCQSFAECYTVQIAQDVWRTVVQYKQSQLQSEQCPRLTQRKQGSPQEVPVHPRAERCSQGHHHLCKNDFLGCTQRRNAARNDDTREAPCVHVLLDEVELLQKKLHEKREMGELNRLTQFVFGKPKHTAWRSDADLLNRTRNLGKYAVRYLEHIENSIDESYLPCPPSRSSSAAEDSSTHVPPAKRDSGEVSGTTGDGSQIRNDVNPNPEEENGNLKTAFDSLIADLVRFQQHHRKPAGPAGKGTETPPSKPPKNVKFSPSSTRKSDSAANASCDGSRSPVQQCAAPSNSSSSLAASEESLKTLSVPQLFDQLDHVVDELLLLMDCLPEQCPGQAPLSAQEPASMHPDTQ